MFIKQGLNKMQKNDWRNIINGLEIPTVSYSDQPFVVKTYDGAWICSVTTGNGHEGAAGQHVKGRNIGNCYLKR